MTLTIQEVRDYLKDHPEAAILLTFTAPAEEGKEAAWKQKQD